MSTTASAEGVGTRVVASFDRYTVLASWARGGMAEVFLALQAGMKGFDKLLALKLLLPELVQDKEFRDMFFAEARTAALLTHANIAHTYDVGESEGRVFMAMEFVNGETLARVLRTIQKEPGARMDQALALTIVRDIAKALHYAHTMKNLDGKALHLVHRDVSPTNLMLSHEGGVKLIDFGVAKIATAERVTSAGVVKGKFAYLSPEQARGETLDGRSDVFSLGCVLWEMLTGERAIKGQSEFELVNSVTSKQIPPPSSAGALCDPELDLIVGMAVANKRDDRHATAKEFADEIDGYLRTNFPDYNAEGEVQALMKRHFSRRAEMVRDLVASRLTRSPVANVKPEDWHLVDLSEGRFSLDSKVSVRKTLSALPGLEAFTAVGVPPPREDGIKKWIALAVGIALIFALVAWWMNMTEATRFVEVTSNPLGADVIVEGEMKGRTPTRVELPLDEEVRVVLTLRGFGEEVAVLPAGDLSSKVSVELSKASTYGMIALDTNPGGARITVDGKMLEDRTPVDLRGLWVGEPHEVIIELDGFAAETHVVSFLSSDTVELAVTLQPSREAPSKPQAVTVEDLVASARVDGVDDSVVESPTNPTIESNGVVAEDTSTGTPEVLVAGALSGVESAEVKLPVDVPAEVEPAVEPLIEPSTNPVSEPATASDAKAERRKKRAEQRAAEGSTKSSESSTQAAKSERTDVVRQPSTDGIELPNLKVTIRSPAVDGNIDAAAVREALKALQSNVLQCYKDDYGKSPFSGFLTLDFTIAGGSAKVSTASAGGDASSGLKDCVVKVIKRGSFPEARNKDVKVQFQTKFDAK